MSEHETAVEAPEAESATAQLQKARKGKAAKAQAKADAKAAKKKNAGKKNAGSKKGTKSDGGFLASIDGTLLSRFAALALLISLVLGGLAFMSLRSLTGSADEAVAAAQDSLGDDGAAAVQVLADQVSSTSSRILLFVGVVTVVGLLAAFALARATAKRVVAPMVQLRDAARATSGALPAFVEACERGDGQIPTLPTVEVPAGGVASDIAASFNEMQHNAANLAITQTFRRTRDGGRFVDLGRSTEQLLNDQMRFIEAMEHDETSAANLQRLFRIDHLASRMRRNAASMLVLADRDTPRQFSRPVSIHQVVQAASSGIEHFDQVSMADLSGVAVNGGIAADLAHLLAEVLETATAGGAGGAATNVAGLPTADGFTVTVTGSGSQLGPADVATINECLTDPAVADATPTTEMTHAVIARLAKRHEIRVELAASADATVTTSIHLPQIALARLTGETTPATPSAERPSAPAPVTAPPVAAPPAMPEMPIEASLDAPATDAMSAAVVSDAHASPPVADIVERIDDPSNAEVLGHDDLAAEFSSAEPAAAAPVTEPEPTPVASPLAATAPAAPEPAAAPSTPEDAAASAADAESAALAERWRVLASGQRAAIEWAMDVEGRGPSNVATALRPGPVSAATLAELESLEGEG